jgi:hypothetical protein
VGDEVSKIITTNLLNALNTNYVLTSVRFKKFPMDEESQETLIHYLSRNQIIRKNKGQIIAFMQGVTQPNSLVSKFYTDQLELCRTIFEQLLPNGVDAELIFRGIPFKVNPKSRVIAQLDKVIKYLEPSLEKNNTFRGRINATSDRQITILNNVKQAVEMNTLSEIENYKQENEIARQHSLMNCFFKHATKTEKTIQDIQHILGGSENNSNR